MSRRYVIRVNLSNSELDYGTVSSNVSTTITTYYAKTDYELNIKYNAVPVSSDDARIPYDTIDHIVITGRYPNGTEFQINDLPYEVSFGLIDAQQFQTYSMNVRINGDPQLTAVIGSIPCLIKIYGENNQVLGSARFGVIVQSADGQPFFTYQRYLDFWPGAIPICIHVNQGDTNVVLRLDAFHTKESMQSIASGNSGGSTFLYYYLDGIRPDGVKLLATGTKTKVTNSVCYFTFTLDDQFTEIPGEVILQMRIISRVYSSGSQGVEKEIRSSKMILVVEPEP